MFCQLPEKEPVIPTSSSTKSSQKNTRRKRKKKSAQKNKKLGVKKVKQSHLEVSMSSWAENFTNAATWQLKHQVAHWKSKVIALEYENNILRDMLRQYYVNGGLSEGKCEINNDNDTGMSVEVSAESEVEEEDNGDDIVPSEEFIEYLRQNREFREAREERRRKANEEATKAERELEQAPPEVENKVEKLKELYGNNWQRIAALEASLQSQFISECDHHKPSFWPNIPLRF